ncbi:MAG: site-2 protease family protein [Acidimicrobiales bacterium]|jgi:Zn-dependent protease
MSDQGPQWYRPPTGSNSGPYGQRGPFERGRSRITSHDPKSLIWIIIIVAVLVILIRSHHVSSLEVIIFCTIVPSIILHEIAHGYVALLFGDDTAKRAGRLTLNPISHVDPVGTLIVPALLALSGLGFFGWAKPVPVNLSKLRSPRNHGVLVALAGPATNLTLAALAVLVFKVLSFNLYAPPGIVERVVYIFGLMNVSLAIFNLLPIPPLDGSVLIERMLPRAWWPGYLAIRRYSMPILIGLVVLNFYMNPGPITWVFNQVNIWWGRLVL